MIEFNRKDFGIGDCFVSKLTLTKKGASFTSSCGTMAATRAQMQKLLSKGQGGFDVTYLNGNEKIISNRNVCGQIVLENVYMTQGWEVGVDNITEADVLEYYEFLKTTPQYGRVEYNMDAGIMELHPRELGTTEWVDGNILGYILNVPLHTTIAAEENATSLLVKDHISFDYRQINIAPNGEFDADKKEVAEYPDDCYLYIQRECEIDGVSHDADTFIKQASTSTTIKNLTDKPNRIVQLWRRYKPEYYGTIT